MSFTDDASDAPPGWQKGDRLATLRPEPDEPRLRTRALADQDDLSREPRYPLRGRRLRRFFTALVVLAILAAGLTIVAAFWARHVMRASLPVIDGTISVEGLSAPVTVTRNAQGVPSIHASTEDDLFFAQGYVTAQDRLWQMDTLRRHAAGELAEILGPGLVQHDKIQRYLQLRAAADRAAASLPADQRRQLEAYARGVNAFIDSHRNNLPLEFHLLHYTPRPWTPRDSLL
ncbi:MAG TPA: penicillin acylase family protein, partial [Polyangiales bacterium]|nr:penicillin acylase family protein [Polyangiales bacterium]